MQTLKRRHKHQAVTNTETQARMPTQKTVQTESETYTRQESTISFVVFFFCVLSSFCCSSSASRVSSTTVCRVFLLILLLLFAFFFSGRILGPLLLLARPWSNVSLRTSCLFVACVFHFWYSSCSSRSFSLLILFFVFLFSFFVGAVLCLRLFPLC